VEWACTNPNIIPSSTLQHQSSKPSNKEAKTPSNKNEINVGAGNLEHGMELIKSELKELKLKMNKSFDDLDKDKKKDQKMNKHKFVQRQMYCRYCSSYQDQTHFCKKKGVYINYDRYNKIIIEADTLAGAQRSGDVDYEDEDVFQLTYKNVMEMD
jgi:hypothetical protein